MLVASMPARVQPTLRPAQTEAQPPAAQDYNGPADERSQPDFKAQRWLKPLSNFLHSRVLVRPEIEGQEKFPQEGPVMICATHQNAADPALLNLLTDRDVRYMAAKEQFTGIQGWFMTRMGAYPVDRKHPSPLCIRHSCELLKEDPPKAVGVFPEAGIPQEMVDGQPRPLYGKVGPLQDGAARIALMARADSVVPIAMQLRENDRFRPLEFLGGLALAGAATAGGVAASLMGGPVLRTAVGTVAGALTGAWIAGRAAAARTESSWWSLYSKFQAGVLASWKGALAGAAVGAGAALIPGLVGLDATAAQVLGLGTSLGAGIAVLDLADLARHRPVARMRVCTPLQVSDYAAKHKNKKEAGLAMTRDLHEVLGRNKAEIAGVPYEPPTSDDQIFKSADA